MTAEYKECLTTFWGLILTAVLLASLDTQVCCVAVGWTFSTSKSRTLSTRFVCSKEKRSCCAKFEVSFRVTLHTENSFSIAFHLWRIKKLASAMPLHGDMYPNPVWGSVCFFMQRKSTSYQFLFPLLLVAVISQNKTPNQTKPISPSKKTQTVHVSQSSGKLSSRGF